MAKPRRVRKNIGREKGVRKYQEREKRALKKEVKRGVWESCYMTEFCGIRRGKAEKRQGPNPDGQSMS